MANATLPGGGGSGDPPDYDPDPVDVAVLDDVRITSRGIYPPESDHGTVEPEVRVTVRNVVKSSKTPTVALFLGDERLGEMHQTIPAGDTATLTTRLSWQSLKARGLAGAEHELRAELRWSSQQFAGPTVTVHERDSGGGPGLPLLPAIGPLTRKQTTLAAALAAALVVAVVR